MSAAIPCEWVPGTSFLASMGWVGLLKPLVITKGKPHRSLSSSTNSMNSGSMLFSPVCWQSNSDTVKCLKRFCPSSTQRIRQIGLQHYVLHCQSASSPSIGWLSSLPSEIVVVPTPVMLIWIALLPPSLTISFSNAATGRIRSITNFHAAA